jgi:hypothetical protein
LPDHIIDFEHLTPNPDKPELKIDPPEAEWMSLLACVTSFSKYARSVLFKSEDILSQFFWHRKQRNNF